MRATARIVVAGACLMGLLTPAPAYALWGGGWLERLSGPGPFSGSFYDHRFLCFVMPDASSGPEVESSLRDHPRLRKFVFPGETGKTAYAAPPGCNFLDGNKPRLEVGLLHARLHSKENVLDYTHRDQGLGTQVNLRSWMVTFDFRVNRMLDVGVAAGRASFSSAADNSVFEKFSTAAFQPMRLTTRPIAAFTDHELGEVVVIRFDATKFNRRFTAEDFGAKPGTFDEPGEILWSWAAVVDLGAILWK